VDNRDAVAARGDPLDEPPHLGRAAVRHDDHRYRPRAHPGKLRG
jgi:hypothetical protein